MPDPSHGVCVHAYEAHALKHPLYGSEPVSKPRLGADRIDVLGRSGTEPLEALTSACLVGPSSKGVLTKAHLQ